MIQLSLLKIRLKQLTRELDKLGSAYTIIFTAVLAGVIFAIYKTIQNDPIAYYYPLILLSLIYSIHVSRKDRRFISLHIQNYKAALFCEYFVFSLPFTLPVLFTPRWYLFLLILTGILLIVNIKTKYKSKTKFPNLSKIIPPVYFEWISGIRKPYLSFPLILFLLSIAFSWLRVVPLIMLWLCTGAIAGFYQECEPLNMLRAGDKNAKSLLRFKILGYSKILCLIYSPILIINIIFNPEFQLINFIFLLSQLAFLFFAITFKYSCYSPLENLKGNTILLSLVQVGSLIPFILPLPIIMGIKYYYKAKKNLASYLE